MTATGPSGNEPAVGPGQDGDQDGSGQQQTSGAQASADGDPDPAPDQAAQPDGDPSDGGPAEGSPAEGRPAEQDTAASHEQDQTAASAGENTPVQASPDPALVTEIAERIGHIQAAASTAATTLASGGDLRAVQTGLDEIYEQAAQARRTVKAAAGGKKATAARPGGLRENFQADGRPRRRRSGNN